MEKVRLLNAMEGEALLEEIKEKFKKEFGIELEDIGLSFDERFGLYSLEIRTDELISAIRTKMYELEDDLISVDEVDIDKLEKYAVFEFDLEGKCCYCNIWGICNIYRVSGCLGKEKIEFVLENVDICKEWVLSIYLGEEYEIEGELKQRVENYIENAYHEIVKRIEKLIVETVENFFKFLQ
jgi:hypothetical protein